ncbi:hypothetical protein C5167_025856 [Papaver somniferum]|uniref:2-(3-amino-3-carboxypropyl)histidine synthase subunit 2 n=1 Tax=Papaver somniferum TaxID=3469 RepID=A0A4Y7JSL2_PAPSO|nr:2-(3-amino-3-carboxypropyl)histidine synthase subunit 2-like [Papaver somniferum]RZC64094.1 hypothetical protein C5167_025856 [Papaver somniferum]
MDFSSNYDITQTANFIYNGNLTRVALQFPDNLLKDSIKVVSELRKELNLLTTRQESSSDNKKEIGLYVLADTTYGSCCVDEVGASHVDADCVVHYGHTCLSPTTTLPAFCVFGKAAIDVSDCVKCLSNCLLKSDKPVLILYGLEYAHALELLRTESSVLCGTQGSSRIHFADVTSSVISPLQSKETPSVKLESSNACTANGSHDNGKETDSIIDGFRHSIGGLTWNLPQGHKMEDYMLFWIGLENPAFSNLVLTYNSSDIVRYDPVENCIMKDMSQTKKILQRRYYIVEKAKDANIIGILVGTLGVAGYLNMINQMKALIARAGKKAYTLLMGKPNPAKLANFPECDVFIYVSCAQTALLDSKDFLSPVITPYEAVLAFNRGSQWTGEYVIGFQDLMTSAQFNVDGGPEEARFSFMKGCYVEDFNQQESINGDEDKERATTDLAEATHKALQLYDKYPKSIIKGAAKSGAEFFSSRSYQGLEMQTDDSVPRKVVTGRTGRAAGYTGEPSKEQNS